MAIVISSMTSSGTRPLISSQSSVVKSNAPAIWLEVLLTLATLRGGQVDALVGEGVEVDAHGHLEVVGGGDDRRGALTKPGWSAVLGSLLPGGGGAEGLGQVGEVGDDVVEADRHRWATRQR
jgi:hypothetical protein